MRASTDVALSPNETGGPTGHPLVLLHGWGLIPHAYARAVRYLTEAHPVVLTPAIAASDGLWNLPGTSRRLHQVVSEHLGAPAVFVGHSLGGGVALAFAAAHPELVAGLVLVDSVGVPSHGRSAASWLSAFPRYVDCMPVATCVRLVATTLRHPSRILDSMSAGAWVLHADLEPLFRAVAASLPAAVVWGASDRLLPSWQGRRMAELLDAPFIEVAGDHDWPLRDPRRFAATITALSADYAAGLHQRRQRSLPDHSTLERTG